MFQTVVIHNLLVQAVKVFYWHFKQWLYIIYWCFKQWWYIIYWCFKQWRCFINVWSSDDVLLMFQAVVIYNIFAFQAVKVFYWCFKLSCFIDILRSDDVLFIFWTVMRELNGSSAKHWKRSWWPLTWMKQHPWRYVYTNTCL